MTTASDLRQAVLTSIPDNILEAKVESKFITIPERHVRALDPARSVVLGDRGTGKSFWWETLASQVGGLIVDHFHPGARTTVSTAFGGKAAAGATFPDPDSIDAISREVGIRALWKSLIGAVVIPTWFEGAASWSARARRVRDEPEAFWAALVARDAELSAVKERRLVLVDAVDRAGSSWTEVLAAHQGLCRVLLDFSALSSIRAKAFLRPDIFDEPDVLRFPDASKLRSTAAELTWSTSELYGLAFQYLANARQGSEAFREVDAGWTFGEYIHGFRHDDTPPSPERQRRTWHALAGPWMGANARRGDTHRWLPNHLADAKGRTTPRSFLAAIRGAAEAAVPSDTLALPPRAIQAGVRHAANIRQREILEDFPWTSAALSPLENTLVPCAKSDVLRTWQRIDLLRQLEGDATGRRRRRHGGDLHGVIDDLVDLGLVQHLSDGRLNIPDVVRLGFGIGRKGGVPRS